MDGLKKKSQTAVSFFTFAVVEKLLCEYWYVEHRSVFAFCIFLHVHGDS